MPDRPEYLRYDPSTRFPAPLPVSGAWRDGDPAGERCFADVCCDRPFVLESGGVLSEVTVAYETWGLLSDARDNAVLVCHALTGTRMRLVRWGQDTRVMDGGTI